MTCRARCRCCYGGRRAQLVQGLPQPEGVHGAGLVVLQQLPPPPSVVRVSSGK